MADAPDDRSILYWLRMKLDGTVVQRGIREFDGSLWSLGIAVIPPKTSALYVEASGFRKQGLEEHALEYIEDNREALKQLAKLKD